jgi:phage FluMu protein Com
MGCTAKQGSLCGHTLEKCPNCKRKHIALSNRCTKKAEATREERQSRMIWQRAFTNAATDVASWKHTVVLGPRPKGAAQAGGEGGSQAEMEDVGETKATGGGGGRRHDDQDCEYDHD